MVKSIFEKEQKILMNGLQTIALISKLEIDYAKGSNVFDVSGKKFLDFFGGVGVCSIGHSHPRYIEVVQTQLHRSVVGSFTTRIRLQYLELLQTILPKELGRIQFYSGGAEAVEAAIRLARSYTGRTEIIGFWGGYHGKTMQTLALSGKTTKGGYPPVTTGIYNVPYANCFRCPVGKSYPACQIYCANFIEQTIEMATSGDIAAIIIEPIQGTAGNIVPPPEFIPLVAEIAHKYDALLIFDEMITGFGRTGRMFGLERYNIVPDIMTLGKGMATGFPLTAVVARDEITKDGPFANPSGSSSSYGGNPLACAAGSATLEVILDEDMVSNARNVGLVILERLKSIKQKHKCIGYIQGEGLMIGVEFVQPANSKPMQKEKMERFFHECLHNGLIAMVYKSSSRLYPPLCITYEEAMLGLDIFEQSLKVLA